MTITREQERYLEERRRLADCADLVFAALREVAAFDTVLEVGCGEGAMLAAALRAGATRVTGIERFAVPEQAQHVPPGSFRVADYAGTGGFDGGGRHDLVLCIELAHALPQPQLSAFLDALVAHGRLVLFSGRIPAQSGDPRAPGMFLADWERAFRRRGYGMLDFFRPGRWAERGVPHWARQNLVLFQKPRPATPATQLGSVVHPFYYDRLLQRAAALEQENALLRQALGVPLAKLRALDEALFAGDEALAARVHESIREKQLRETANTRHVATLCAGNDLILAAHHFLRPMVEPPATPERHLRIQAARIAEAMGEPALAWDQLEAAGETATPTGNLVQLALRLGRGDWLGTALAPGAPREVARFAPLLGKGAEHAGAAAPPVYVVNLPTDRYRRRRAERSLASFGIAPRFRRGYRPMEIPPEDHRLYPGYRLDRATDGSLGHQYAEYLIWREVAAGADPVVMTMEDDSLLLAHPGAVLAGLDLPPDWDIIFTNPRLDMTVKIDPPAERFQLTPFAEAFIRHSHASPGQAGFGLDSVILSREGARKLVRIVESEGFHSVGTDWYVQSHCVPPERLGEFLPESRIHDELQRRFARPRFDRTLLNGHVLSPALTQVFALGVDRTRRM